MRYSNRENRATGVVVPVGALRGTESIGVGEFLDLIPLADLCKSVGLDLIQLLPVNDSGFQSSPYSALSAFALHPLYLRIGDLPEAAGKASKLAGLRARFDGAPRFAYAELLAEKIKLLREIFTENAPAIVASCAPGGLMDAWIKANPWVIEYAVYQRLKEANKGKHWKEWKAHRSPTAADIRKLWQDEKLKSEHLFWAWVQQALDEQFTRAAAYVAGQALVLKGDLPILMNEDSCDVWAHPEFFRRDLAAGAPPDMFSPLGQNWQFPIYDWDALGRDDFSWWRRRLELADRYYSAYRIDHVLGFFRIWAASRDDYSAVLGRFIPSLPLEKKELAALGFDSGRLRWLSQPHLPSGEIYDALRAAGLDDAAVEIEAQKTFAAALQRIGSEELWLFKAAVRGERDVAALTLHPAAAEYLQRAWRNRVLLEYAADTYAPAWSYWDTRAFPTLSEGERRNLEALISQKRRDSEASWETQGRRLLSVLISSSPMLACAEDLGAVPDCVPRVLGELGVLGLRVVRWARRWGEPGEPYTDLDAYPELSVCTPAVHDSSTVREWWEREADRDGVRAFIGDPSLGDAYSPDTARRLLGGIARARSRLCVFQIQDLLHLSSRWYAPDSAAERVNVPGSVNDFNWTYRLPASIAEIAADAEFKQAAAALCAVRSPKRNKQ